MRILIAILLFLLSNLDSCVSRSVSVEDECQEAENTILVGEMDGKLMNLYNAVANNSLALQHESTVCAPGFSLRVMPNRTRTASNVNIRQVLLSTHKPVVSRLIHYSIIQLVAFPKEYLVFRLRCILI